MLMKTIKKCMLLLLFLVLPLVVLAEPKEYIPISKRTSIDLAEVEISSITFVDNSSKPSNNFGLIIEVKNEREENYTLKSKISYYNKEKVLLYSKVEEHEILNAQTNTLISLIDRRQNSKFSISDIAFYTTDFEIVEPQKKFTEESILESDSCKNSDYTITDYDVTIDVQKDNTYNISEKFKVHYDKQVPVIRRIPKGRTVKNRDETISSYRLKVLSVEEKENMRSNFQVDSGLVVNIDVPNEETSEEIYSLDYSFIKKDRSATEHIDFTIDPEDFSSCLGHISFEINLPSKTDSSAIQMTSKIGLDKSSEVQINKVENTIFGKYDGILSDDSLTISFFVDDDYFEPKTSMNPFLCFFIPTVLIFTSFILYIFFGKDVKVKVKSKDRIPSHDILEFALAKKGRLDNSDITLILLSLADAGYIKFKKKNKKLTSSTREYEIIKLKEYTGKNIFERKLMRELFADSLDAAHEDILKANYDKAHGSKKVKDISNLTTSNSKEAYKLNALADEIISETYRTSYNRIFEKSSIILTYIISIFNYIILLSILILPTLEYGTIEDALIIGTLLFITILGFKEGILKSHNTLTRIGSLIMIFLSILISRVTPLWETLFYESAFVYGIIFGFAMIVLNNIFISIMPKKTHYGTELTTELANLEAYLKSLDASEFAKKLIDEPNYLSKLLPYLFLTDCDKQIIKQATSLKLEPPDWLENTNIKNLNDTRHDLEIMFKKRVD